MRRLRNALADALTRWGLREQARVEDACLVRQPTAPELAVWRRGQALRELALHVRHGFPRRAAR
jgi:hypothetical protein